MKAFGCAVSVLCCLMQFSFLSCLPLTGSNFQDLFKGQSKCLNDFSSQVRSIVDTTKARSLSCLNAADIRFKVNEKIQLMQKLSDKCSLESNLKDYFACVKNIAEDNRKLLNEIAIVKEIFSKNFAIIKEKKEKCLASVSAESIFETARAKSDLHLCLQENDQPREEIRNKHPSPTDMEDFMQKLDIVKEKYETLKDCLSTETFETCWEDASLYRHKLNETMSIGRYLKDQFFGNTSDYFTKITDIDLAENSCLRQYIVKQKYSEYKFDMEGCIKFGFRSIEDSEENYEKDKKLIQILIEIEGELKKCRQITKNLDTHWCIGKILSFSENTSVTDVQQKTSIKSEKAFKKLKEIISFLYSEEYPCLGDLYAFLRFNELDINFIEYTDNLYCFMNGHEVWSYKDLFKDPAMDEVLANLQSIQDYTKNCSEHPESPGFAKCFENAFWIKLTSLEMFNNKYENYKEAIEESDKTNHTCFEKMLRDSKKVYEENPDVRELEECVLKN